MQVRITSKNETKIRKQPDYSPLVPWARLINKLIDEALGNRAEKGKKTRA